MKRTITIKRFTAAGLFKIVAIGSSISIVAFTLLMGIFALFGAQTIHFNHKPVTGMAGLIASPFIGLLLAAFGTFFAWIGFAFSFWMFSKFGSLRVDYISDESPEQAVAPA